MIVTSSSSFFLRQAGDSASLDLAVTDSAPAEPIWRSSVLPTQLTPSLIAGRPWAISEWSV